jgi:glycosyltransferase involved in cell wall biosynthesis
VLYLLPKGLKMPGVIFFFHCGMNTGYAIKTLEDVFLGVGYEITKDVKKIHFAFTKLSAVDTKNVSYKKVNIIKFNPATDNEQELLDLRAYISRNQIRIAIGFDQPVYRPVYRYLRQAGVKLIVSYYGAPMSSLNSGFKLFLKRLEVMLVRNQPDLYIFESVAMANTAIYGRGIKKKNTEVIYLGVDEKVYCPNEQNLDYAYNIFNIPRNRKIFFYSGHMEERKGVRIIIQAAKEIILKYNQSNIHFLLIGNKNGEEMEYYQLYKNTLVENCITFGGYRNDVNLIMQSCFAGIIASTGWDSFTMSSLEIAASGVPLIVSNLQGLAETIENNKTGLLFESGNANDLVEKIFTLYNNDEFRNILAKNARDRIVAKFTKNMQVRNLYEAILNRFKVKSGNK